MTTRTLIDTRVTLGQRLLPREGILEHAFVRNGLLLLSGTLLLAVCASVAIRLPWTPVPITMQTFAVLLVGALFGPRLGAATVIAYLLEGVLGLPVFAGGLNAWSPSAVPGLPVIVGPTAGYLYAFPLAAALVGYLAVRGWDRRIVSAVASMLMGSLVILICGFLWLGFTLWRITGTLDLTVLLAQSVLPFLPGDALKVGLAALILPGAWVLMARTKRRG